MGISGRVPSARARTRRSTFRRVSWRSERSTDCTAPLAEHERRTMRAVAGRRTRDGRRSSKRRSTRSRTCWREARWRTSSHSSESRGSATTLLPSTCPATRSTVQSPATSRACASSRRSSCATTPSSEARSLKRCTRCHTCATATSTARGSRERCRARSRTRSRSRSSDPLARPRSATSRRLRTATLDGSLTSRTPRCS